MDYEAVFSDLIMRAHCTALEHGWWDKDRGFAEQIALMHSELSEALEDWRNGRVPSEIYVTEGKLEGIPIEFADVLIRIFDTCAAYKIPLAKAIKEKMDYNNSRPYRHGGKLA